MFVQRLNEVRIVLEIAPAAPLLVKEGRHLEEGNQEARFFNRDAVRLPRRNYDTADTCFDMAFVYSQTARGGRFYLPGSSLRGIMRTVAERLIARWQPEWVRTSDPFNNLLERQIMEQRAGRASPTGPEIYRMAGPVERCFGHSGLRGRWIVADGWLQDDRAATVVVRDGVGIDRQTGAAAQSVKFEFEAITGGVFRSVITLVNYELWQLGLLAHVLAVLDNGDVRLGYGSRRGLGHIRVAVAEMEWRWYGAATTSEDGEVVLPSLATLGHQAGLPVAYGWRDADQRLRLPLRPVARGIGSSWRLEPARIVQAHGFATSDWDALPWPRFAELLVPVLRAWSPPVEAPR